jgi:hypothetical protein
MCSQYNPFPASTPPFTQRPAVLLNPACLVRTRSLCGSCEPVPGQVRCSWVQVWCSRVRVRCDVIGPVQDLCSTLAIIEGAAVAVISAVVKEKRMMCAFVIQRGEEELSTLTMSKPFKVMPHDVQTV